MAHDLLVLPARLESAAVTADATAVTADLEPYRRELTGYCYRMLGAGSEAEDAVQETMLRAWKNAESFEGTQSPRTTHPSRDRRNEPPRVIEA